MHKGWDAQRGAFVQAYASPALDTEGAVLGVALLANTSRMRRLRGETP